MSLLYGMWCGEKGRRGYRQRESPVNKDMGTEQD